MSETKVNWKQVLVTALLTGTVTVCTGMLLFTFQQREPLLTYEITDAVPFEGGQEKLAIYNIRVRNDGRKAAKDVVCRIDISPATIAQSHVSADPSLVYTASDSGSLNILKSSTVNPDEGLTVSLLTRNFTPTARTPQVSLRGDGIMGRAASGSTFPRRFQFLESLGAAFAGLFAAAIQLIVRRRHSQSGRHSEDQRKVLSYIFGVRGRTIEAERYLRMTEDVSYWSEADCMTSAALVGNAPAALAAVTQVLEDILNYAQIHKESAAILHYNLARLEKAQGRPAEGDKHLAEARKTIPKLVERRLALEKPLVGLEKRA